ncbi:SRPBCC family protein [Arthrobacter sp. M4]|uniref:SRPBCC family protein n=1 Tax=Arthrobacter sp. M4 TaxID=218160 RepID=UPI001CDCDD85|nr:SRPBCC family protein [Arthrobacter sp. M4]MCA4134188.1 SRPBCC family protein [Arthrobacter sp. M4]
MANVQESIEVSVPLSQAYNQWTQFKEFPRFMSGVESVTQIDDTTVHFTMDIGGVRREFDAKIVEQIPDEKITWQSVEGPQNSGTVTFVALSATETKVTVDLTWEPESMLEKLGASLRLDDRQIQHDLRRFKEFIEGQEVETGGWRGTVTEGEVE